MGAYYEYQFKRENGTMTNIHPFETSDLFPELKKLSSGQKFLESFYVGNQEFLTGFLYAILKLNKKMIVNTVCDCDITEEKGKDFINVLKTYGKNPNYTETEIKGMQEIVQDISNNIELFKRFEQGVIICHEKKQYFKLKDFFVTNSLVVDPLALLTRSSKSEKGGGDFDISYVNNKDEFEFKSNPSFDENLISSWKDLQIEYVEKIPQDYENIGKKIKLIKKNEI